MANKSMRYDHPAYTAPQTLTGTIAAAANSQWKFPAWTTMVVKSMTISSLVSGTGAGTEVFVLQRVQLDPTLGTATTSIAALATNTAAMYSKHVQGTYTFTQGELICITKGADATSQYAVSVEAYLDPGANVTG
jgi:hypothetical protein